MMTGRASKSFWMVIAVLLLVDSCAGALVGRSSGRRGGDGDLGDVVSGFLSEEADVGLGYVGIGIQLIEEGIAEYLGGLTDRHGAQDRILLENVQVGWQLLEHKMSFCWYILASKKVKCIIRLNIFENE